MLSVERSPASVSWMIVCNGVIIDTRPTKKEAQEYVSELKEKYRL